MTCSADVALKVLDFGPLPETVTALAQGHGGVDAGKEILFLVSRDDRYATT
jgi:hypothetical protein